MEGETVRLAVLAPHGLLSHGVIRLAQDAPGLDVVAHCTTGEEGLVQIAALRPDVAVVSTDLPDRLGVVTCGDVAMVSPRTRCILLQTDGSAGRTATALVVGVITPGQPLADVEALLRTAGGAGAPSQDGAAANDTPPMHEHDPRQSLTPREATLFSLLGEGLINPEIATAMHVGVPTVRNYVSQLLRKLEVPNRGRLIALAARLEAQERIDRGERGAGPGGHGSGPT